MVAVPLPMQGHLNWFMHFFKLLASQGIVVTFLNIDPVHHRIEELTNQQGAKEEVEKVTTATTTNHGEHCNHI